MQSNHSKLLFSDCFSFGICIPLVQTWVFGWNFPFAFVCSNDHDRSHCHAKSRIFLRYIFKGLQNRMWAWLGVSVYMVCLCHDAVVGTVWLPTSARLIEQYLVICKAPLDCTASCGMLQRYEQSKLVMILLIPSSFQSKLPTHAQHPVFVMTSPRHLYTL